MAEQQHSNAVLRLIGVAKLFKAALLIFLALELHRILGPASGDRLAEFFKYVRVDPGNHYVHALIARATGVNPQTLHRLRIGSLLYASLFTIEGVGLLLARRWAEYMTVITTSLLLPLEVMELFHGHHRAGKAVLLLFNVAIVVYLVWQLVKTHREAKSRGFSLWVSPLAGLRSRPR